MNDYFVNMTETIGLKQFQVDHHNDLLEDHTSIIRIKFNLNNVSDKFDKKVHEKEVKQKQYITVLYQSKFLNNLATYIIQ